MGRHWVGIRTGSNNALRLAGIDLAWKSDKNTTAVSIGDLEGSRLQVERIEPNLSGLDELKALFDGESRLVGVAIDGPLIVPNEFSRRECESELTSDYIRRKIGCHSTNLHRYPDASSVKLSSYLEAKGFQHLGDVSEGRYQIECYPHPAIVEIFGLPERLKYKKGTVMEKRRGQIRLGEYIHALEKSQLVSLLVREKLASYFSAKHINRLSGMDLKTNEDVLDSIICLYVCALYAIRLPYKVYGSRQKGYIYVPRQKCTTPITSKW
jgi:predicted RNase H-like nuclease